MRAIAFAIMFCGFMLWGIFAQGGKPGPESVTVVALIMAVGLMATLTGFIVCVTAGK